MMNWKAIKADQCVGRFYLDGKPIFKQFKRILKFHEPGLAPVEDESGWYHITAEGLPLYSERYLRAFGFYCCRAAVTAEDGCFHIGDRGMPLYAERYAWCGNFQEGFCAVCDTTNNYFHIDVKGDRLYTSTYSYVGDFRDGIACVKCSDGLWRHIKSNGEFLNCRGFVDIGVFHKNIAPVKDADGWFHMTASGVQLYSDRYLAIEPFYNGFALVVRADYKKVIIDERGSVVRMI